MPLQQSQSNINITKNYQLIDSKIKECIRSNKNLVLISTPRLKYLHRKNKPNTFIISSPISKMIIRTISIDTIEPDAKLRRLDNVQMIDFKTLSELKSFHTIYTELTSSRKNNMTTYDVIKESPTINHVFSKITDSQKPAYAEMLIELTFLAKKED